MCITICYQRFPSFFADGIPADWFNCVFTASVNHWRWLFDFRHWLRPLDSRFPGVNEDHAHRSSIAPASGQAEQELPCSSQSPRIVLRVSGFATPKLHLQTKDGAMSEKSPRYDLDCLTEPRMARRHSVSTSECGFGVENSPMRGIIQQRHGSKEDPDSGVEIRYAQSTLP
jgi:hypothetical protein